MVGCEERGREREREGVSVRKREGERERERERGREREMKGWNVTNKEDGRGFWEVYVIFLVCV